MMLLTGIFEAAKEVYDHAWELFVSLMIILSH